MQRVIATPSQTSLNRQERLRNLKKAFAASPEVAGRHILILDDTMTTGTNLRRLSECLLAAGAAQVEGAVIAVTPLGEKDESQIPDEAYS